MQQNPPGLQELWPEIQSLREQLADEVQKIARDFPGPQGKRLKRCAAWFRQPADFETAIKRPDMVAMTLPFVPLFRSRSTVESGKQAESSIAGLFPLAVRTGACNLVRQTGSGNPVHWPRLLYLLLLLAGCAGLWILFSFRLAPQLEDFLADDRIELARVTVLVLAVASFIRSHIVGLGAALAALAAGLLLFWLLRPTLPRESRLRRLIACYLTPHRSMVARWAWHCSLLLESGLPEERAVLVAGDASPLDWLRSACHGWVNRRSRETPAGAEFSPGQSEPAFVIKSRFQWLNPVMVVPSPPARIVLLRELANCYGERAAGTQSWVSYWLVAFVKSLLMAGIALMILGFYSPLLAVIGSLSSGAR